MKYLKLYFIIYTHAFSSSLFISISFFLVFWFNQHSNVPTEESNLANYYQRKWAKERNVQVPFSLFTLKKKTEFCVFTVSTKLHINNNSENVIFVVMIYIIFTHGGCNLQQNICYCIFKQERMNSHRHSKRFL